MKVTRYIAIDFVKYIAAILIIAIHTALFQDINSTLYFAVVHIICRIAVPFFALCTGYFMASKSIHNSRSSLLSLLFGRQWKKLLSIYIVWSVIYLIYLIPQWIQTGWFSYHAFIDYALAFILSKPYYHMWYVLSALYAIPLLNICLKYVDKKYFLPLACILWFVKVITYGYSQWLPASFIPLLQLLEKVSGIRDGLFCILPLMLLGSHTYFQKERQPSFYRIGFLVSFLCFAIEALMLRHFGQEAVSFIFFVFPTSYFFFHLILRSKFPVPRDICQVLGAASLFIYLVHPLVLEYLRLATDSSVLLFLATTVISTLFGICYAKIMRGLKTRRQPNQP